MHPPPIIAAAFASAIALAGCGIHDPLNDPSAAGSPKSGPPGVVRHLDPKLRRSVLAAAAPTPTAALERFARLYINWNEHNLAAQQRTLAAISIGEASSTEAQAAAHTPADYELHNSHLANKGRIVAIAPSRPARPGSYMVVTRERTTGTGTYDQLAPAYHLTIATVRRIPGGWTVSQWHPQI
jgi:hypothetical protein